MQDTIKTEIIENYMKEHNLSKNKFWKISMVYSNIKQNFKQWFQV